jgi:hypothetical protein
MTEDELKEIEARYDPISPFASWGKQEPRQDVLALIAEVRMLQSLVRTSATCWLAISHNGMCPIGTKVSRLDK